MPATRLAALVLAVTLAAAGPSWAAGKPSDVEVTPGRVTPSKTATSATFTVKNLTDHPLSRISVVCSLLDDTGQPKDVRDKDVANVGGRQTVYDSMLFYHTTETGTLTCRASEVD